MSAANRWRVLIAEDDLRLASIYARALTEMPRLQLSGVVTSGEQTVAHVGAFLPDLLILDLQLVGVDGLTALRQLRSAGSTVEVIVITERRDLRSVRSAVQHGALDYIVMPFELERLRRAVGLFFSRMAALHSDWIDQKAVDRVSGAFYAPRRWLPRGLSEELLRRVQGELERQDELISSLEVAQRTGLARVTVRRYLEYLACTNQATVVSEPHGAGRPRKLYRRNDVGGLGRRTSGGRASAPTRHVT